MLPARMTLAQLLRDELGLTGTKVSCDLQVCGACSVLMDGEPVSSCTLLAADADGGKVETVEGLASPGGLSDLQEAFMDNFALQCGFCTPGFLMMATSLLRENPSPSRDEVTRFLEGNICRCTGYQPIVDAILQVAEARRPDDRD
jgi:aerobic-type carbon monoxide dehydrogenase small subunit (CoxS/CutS family)